MTRLIRSLPFLYGYPLVFIYLSFYFRASLSGQVALWGCYVALSLYLPLVEKTTPAFPALLVVAVYVADFFLWGNRSPAVALLFAALPLVMARRPGHYPWYVAIALLSLVIPGTFAEPQNFALYILLLLCAAVIYLLGRDDLLKKFFGATTVRVASTGHAAPRQAVADPHMALKKYLERMRTWRDIPISIRVVEIRGETGLLLDTQAFFPLTGLILLAIRNRREIACNALLEEKEHLPLLPEYDHRVYFPMALFDTENPLAVPEYVIVVDARFSGDKQVLVDSALPLRDDVLELLRMAATFERVLTERKRQEKLYRGAREMLDAFNRERLFSASAWSVLNFVPDAAAVLITERREDDHAGNIYRLTERREEMLSIDDLAPVAVAPLRDATSIQALMLEGKVGKMTEIREIRKRKEKNLLFADPEFAELNRQEQMLSYLLQHKDRTQGTLSVFLDSDRTVEPQTKTDLLLLARILSSALNNIEMYETVQNLSNIDGLTGLYNRRYLQDRIAVMVSEAARSGMPLSAIMLDIDHFKKVNDRYGHKAGDDAIRFISRVIKGSTRKVDVAARYGGEEFVILLHNTTHEGALKVAEKLREVIQGSVVPADGHQLNITSSFGVSSYPTLVQNGELLIKSADEALYLSKEGGRNRVTLYEPKP